jgi:hypothetical protein
MRRSVLFVIILAILIITPWAIKGAVLNHNQYPKLANLFYRWHIEDDEVAQLAKWDILIIDMEVQTYSPQHLIKLKQLNPDIKLLAYLASEEIRGDSGTLNGTLRQKLYNRIRSEWWLKDSSGRHVAWWEPNPMVNVTFDAPMINGKRWHDELPLFVRDELMSSGYWDGVFYDNVWDNIGFLSYLNIDLDQNNSPEADATLNQKWRQGMNKLLDNTRKTLGSEYLVMGNGGEYYYEYINGALYETFPVQGWKDTLSKYFSILDKGVPPSIGIINTNVENTGKQNNYKKMRYGLTSALLGNGYYGFDNGDQSHNEIWWYDEYEASLGNPAGEPVNVKTGSKVLSEGVWRRDFNNGMVLVNSSNKDEYIELGGEYEKLHGTQDSWVNDGLFVSGVDVPARDGLVLLRPLDEIFDATYINGSFARVFNGYGHVARSGFFAYKNQFQGSNQIIEQDIDNDGKREIVVANKNKVIIYEDDGTVVNTFFPYTKNYDKGINITVGDLDNNGTMEIVTGTEWGGGPHVRIFNSVGKLINPGFFAYGPEFRGGVNVTIADLEGDGYYEIIAGAGVGGGPHVRVFAADGKLINPGFFAYDPGFRGGVNVAGGDVDGDGVDEIITGPGQGGGAHVKVFDKNGKIDGPEFMAFDSSLREGVEVAATDMDGDGKVEIIATTTNVFTLAGF